MTPNAAVPVEAILKLALDKTGEQGIRDFLDQHEQQWSRIEQTVNRVGSGLGDMASKGAALLGVAGVGSLISNLIGSSQAGANVAVAGGHVLGGAGTWHPFGQALLGAQAQTGVDRVDIAQGLVQALQTVGGTMTPRQAQLVGGLLAGFGQTTGMTPAQIAQVIGPILQASGEQLTGGDLAQTMAGIQSALTQAPGSQAAPLLPIIASLVTGNALGGGTLTPSLAAGLVNSAITANPIFRNTGVLSAATGGITGGLQNAYTNPSIEAFLQMAGIGYDAQRQGLTPGNVRAIDAEATRLYGTGSVRDMALRSMFGGIPGADLLEGLGSGRGAAALSGLGAHATPGQIQNLFHEVQHNLLRTTPQGELNRGQGGILHFLENSPLTLLGGALGLAFGPKLLQGVLGKGAGLLGRGASRLFGGAADSAAGSAAEDAGGSLFGDLLGGGLRIGAGGVLGGIAGPLLAPDIAGAAPNITAGEQAAVRRVLQLAAKRFGPSNLRSRQARDWMEEQLYNTGHASQQDIYGMRTLDQFGFSAAEKLRGGAGQMLDNALGDAFATDPFSKLAASLDALNQTIGKLTGTTGSHFSSYDPAQGGGGLVGTSGVQGLAAAAPGLELTAFMLGQGGGGGGGTAFASLNLGTPAGGGGGGGGQAPSGAGWSDCLMTWYDPALGGINSSNGAANPHSAMANGQPYSPTAMTCAAPSQYAFGTQIEFSYGGRTVTCTVTDRGGAITGAHFDLARAPAAALGIISVGAAHGKFRVTGQTAGHPHSGPQGSAGTGNVMADTARLGGGGGLSVAAPAAPAGGGGAGVGGQPVHLHVHVDGREIQKQRLLLGHKA